MKKLATLIMMASLAISAVANATNEQLIEPHKERMSDSFASFVEDFYSLGNDVAKEGINKFRSDSGKTCSKMEANVRLYIDELWFIVDPGPLIEQGAQSKNEEQRKEAIRVMNGYAHLLKVNDSEKFAKNRSLFLQKQFKKYPLSLKDMNCLTRGKNFIPVLDLEKAYMDKYHNPNYGKLVDALIAYVDKYGFMPTIL